MARRNRPVPDPKTQQPAAPPEDLGLLDPRDVVVNPGEPHPGVGHPLEVEPLPGPTEASNDDDVDSGPNP
jgi:hypothetical protein